MYNSNTNNTSNIVIAHVQVMQPMINALSPRNRSPVQDNSGLRSPRGRESFEAFRSASHCGRTVPPPIVPFRALPSHDVLPSHSMLCNEKSCEALPCPALPLLSPPRPAPPRLASPRPALPRPSPCPSRPVPCRVVPCSAVPSVLCRAVCSFTPCRAMLCYHVLCQSTSF